MSEPAIPHFALKDAIVEAGVPPEIAIRALARIDSDAEFRSALEAAHATEDPAALANVVRAQFPNKRRKQPKTVVENQREEALKFKGVKYSAKELQRLINEQALLLAADYLTPGRLEELVRATIQRYIEPLILGSLGCRHHNDGTYTLRENSVFAARIRKVAEKQSVPALEQFLSKGGEQAMAAYLRKQEKRLTRGYQEAFEAVVDEQFEEICSDKAERAAKKHLSAFLKKIGKDE